SATPAAVRKHAVVLLTHGTSPAPETTTWLSRHPGLARYAVGSAASHADPSATSYAGSSAAQTAVLVAAAFYGSASHAAVVGSGNFTPGLVASVRLRASGPLLYASGSTLSADTAGRIHAMRSALALVDLIGG